MPLPTMSQFPDEIEVPREFDLEDVAREYEAYGHRVERDVPHHRLAIVWAR